MVVFWRNLHIRKEFYRSCNIIPTIQTMVKKIKIMIKIEREIKIKRNELNNKKNKKISINNSNKRRYR